MTPSDIQAWADLVQKGSVVTVLIAVVVALAWLVRYLFNLVLSREAKEREYREAQIAQLQAQLSQQQGILDRQQDLFDQAMDLLGRRGGTGVTP